ncbi:MAG TPA: mycofactocin precursor [Acidimicrobiaceae bacterium]|nr:mycofactocin precursor [Acidimicrobiaceae bacterium]|tara:strand:+ start:297 stop:428 length:132 start_codon:yes stop_codon:yes gene_type:complete
MTVTEPTTEASSEVEDQEQATEELVTDDVLVEEISIDGMCGVY